MSFLTVEDVNTMLYNNGVKVHYYEIDTSIIGDSNFVDVRYDFCTITRRTYNNQYYFYVKIDNDLWTGGYYVLKTNYEILYSTDDYDDGVLYIGDVEEPCIIIGLVLQSDYAFEDNEINKKWIDSNIVPITLNELNTVKSIRVWNIQHGLEETYSLECDTIGVKEITVHNINAYIVLMKTDFQFNCTQTLTVGKVNKVRLGTDNKYKPNGALVGSYTPTITVQYGSETLPVSYDGTDYYFNLDLTSLTEPKNIRFTVKVEANEVLNSTETSVKLTSDYPTVNTFSALQSACNGNSIIKLGANITFTNRISITNSIKIIGNDKVLDLNGYGFNLLEDKQLIIENIQLNNGDTAIKQGKNSKLELNNVSFNHNISSNYSNLGSCILCDIDYPSLSVEDDFITDLTNCLFTDNHNTILSGGELNINNCKFHNTDTDYADKSNTAFLYQVDGEATIVNSVFDIDYTGNELCEGEVNVGFAQTVFMLGETAKVNGYSYNELTIDNMDTFFDEMRNNRSHIYVKYYYPQITACVYTSPILNYENKSLCYSLSGDDYIYKVNSQVTRANWQTENNNRTINW